MAFNISVNGGQRHNASVREGGHRLLDEAKAHHEAKKTASNKTGEHAAGEIARDITAKAKGRVIFHSKTGGK